MSLFRRGLAAAAGAGARVAEKYIDEDLAAQRAQMLADLQFQGQKRLDEYQNSPERRAALREQGVLDDMARTDPRITQRQIDAEVTKLRGTAPARAEAESEVIRGTAAASAERESLMARARTDEERRALVASGNDPAVIKAKRALALAGHIESSGSVAQAELARMQIADLRRLGALYDQFTAIQNEATPAGMDPAKHEEDKLRRARPILNGIQAIKSKNGGGEKRDPELDTTTITTEEPTDSGGTVKTTQKVVRRPGAPGPAGKGDDPAGIADRLRSNREKAQGGKPAAAPAAPAPDRDPIQMMTVGELRRLAAIQGHAQQQAAVAELQRRRLAAPPEATQFPQ